MNSIKLREDLSNCLINFDSRILITELLDDYQLSYEEVNTIVQEFLEQQEKKEKLKYEKRFLVCGVEEQQENKKECYEIVEESKLKDWLAKLHNAECSLYSVKVAGGAQPAAQLFKPMRVVECVQSKQKRDSKTSSVNDDTECVVGKKPIKEENQKETTKQQLFKPTPKTDSSIKTSPKAEITSPEEKGVDKKASSKKGINNFFAPSTATTKKSDIKPKTGIVKPPSPKKILNFFKKQTESPAISTENNKKTENNTSVQIFDDSQEEAEEALSSDEEEKLEALKRDIISSDVEIEEDENDQQTSIAKRRRILDSDDDEADPPVKQEKIEIKEQLKEEMVATAETYLDEDGFVITKKSKQKDVASSSKSPTTKRKPAVTLKTTPNESKKTSTSKDTKSVKNPTAKTKQAQIMNFFSKK